VREQIGGGAMPVGIGQRLGRRGVKRMRAPASRPRFVSAGERIEVATIAELGAEM
jgi:hypothetical protein